MPAVLIAFLLALDTAASRLEAGTSPEERAASGGVGRVKGEQDPLPLETFDADPPRFQAKGSTLMVEQGGGIWRTEMAGAELILDGLPEDLSRYGALSLQIGAEGPEIVVLEIRLTDAEGTRALWRRVDLPAGRALEITIPFYSFRRSGASPRLGRPADARRLRLRCRAKKATVRLDNVRLLAEGGWREPADDLKKRVAAAGVRVREGPRARVFTDCAALDLDALEKEIEAFWTLFREKLGLKDAAPEQATLVIFEKAEDYRRFVRDTGRLLYAAGPPELASSGYTFERTSVSSCDGASHRLRPVFFHELAHQWTADALDLPVMNGWAHEGICYYLQRCRFPSENLARDVKGILAADRLRPAADFKPGFVPAGGFDNFQAMLLVEYLLEGPRRDRLPAVLDALAQGKDLVSVIEKTLAMTVPAFEDEFRKFCARRYP